MLLQEQIFCLKMKLMQKEELRNQILEAQERVETLLEAKWDMMAERKFGRDFDHDE